jgi:hypothetical protein
MTFAGFSRDGSRFAFVAGSATGGDLHFLKIVTPGKGEPDSHFLDAQDAPSLSEARALLKAGGYSRARRAAPPALTMQPNLTATPPTLALELDGRTRFVDVGAYPYPPTDHAEIWGLSPDGRTVAVHVAGPAVRSALVAKPGAGTVEFYFLARLP